MRNARAEAAARLGGHDGVRVLEPSPPAITTPPFWADDPLEGGEILPIERAGTRTWLDTCEAAGDPELRRWCAERWLVRGSPAPLPPEWEATRRSLHAVAEHLLAPLRYRATGKIGLRFTYRGFGTPFFADHRQARIEDGVLIDRERRHELRTLGLAGQFLGIEPGPPAGLYESAGPVKSDEPLVVAPDAARALGDWFGFCASLLEQLRADAVEEDEPSRVQLWPEHFDLAVEIGPDGGRANFGGSPGDAGHAEPYLYVGPWEPRHGGFWNEPFGASLGYDQILAGADPWAFLRRAKELLNQ